MGRLAHEGGPSRLKLRPTKADRALLLGLNTFGGACTYKGVADAHGLEYVAIEKALG